MDRKNHRMLPFLIRDASGGQPPIPLQLPVLLCSQPPDDLRLQAVPALLSTALAVVYLALPQRLFAVGRFPSPLSLVCS